MPIWRFRDLPNEPRCTLSVGWAFFTGLLRVVAGTAHPAGLEQGTRAGGRPALWLIPFLLAAPAHAENWPGWRGPARTGVTGDSGVPTTWSATDNVLWKVPLPGTGTAN